MVTICRFQLDIRQNELWDDRRCTEDDHSVLKINHLSRDRESGCIHHEGGDRVVPEDSRDRGIDHPVHFPYLGPRQSCVLQRDLQFTCAAADVEFFRVTFEEKEVPMALTTLYNCVELAAMTVVFVDNKPTTASESA